MTSTELRAAKLAAGLRAQHSLGVAPIKDLFELAHSLPRVDVASIEAAGDEHGLCMRDADSGRVIIFVATTAHPMRQRSTIAHEIGHVICGDLESGVELVPGTRSPEEVLADTFARHLLLPLDAVRDRFGAVGIQGLIDLSNVVQEYEVSPAIAAIQLKEAGLIDQATCTQWCALSAPQLAATHGWLSQYQALAEASQVPRAPQRLMTRAVAAYRQGGIGLTEVSIWYGIPAEELRAQVGDVVAPAPVDEELDDDWDFDGPLFDDDGHAE